MLLLNKQHLENIQNRWILGRWGINPPNCFHLFAILQCAHRNEITKTKAGLPDGNGPSFFPSHISATALPHALHFISLSSLSILPILFFFLLLISIPLLRADRVISGRLPRGGKIRLQTPGVFVILSYFFNFYIFCDGQNTYPLLSLSPVIFMSEIVYVITVFNRYRCAQKRISILRTG